MSAFDIDRRITRVRVSNVVPSPQFPKYLYLSLDEALRLQAALTEFLADPEEYRARPPSESHVAKINVKHFRIPGSFNGPAALRPREAKERFSLLMRHIFPDRLPTSKEERLEALFPYLRLSARARKGLIRMGAHGCWAGILSYTYADVLAMGRKKLFDMRNVGVTTRKVFDDIMESQGLLEDWLDTESK